MLGDGMRNRVPKLNKSIIPAHHEESITVEIDGKYWNIPTVVNGKKLNQRQASDWAIKTKKNFGVFNSLDEAIAAAKKRSKAAGTKHPTN